MLCAPAAAAVVADKVGRSLDRLFGHLGKLGHVCSELLSTSQEYFGSFFTEEAKEKSFTSAKPILKS